MGFSKPREKSRDSVQRVSAAYCGYEAWPDKVHEVVERGMRERARDWASLTCTVSSVGGQGWPTGAQLKPPCRLRALFQPDGSPAPRVGGEGRTLTASLLLAAVVHGLPVAAVAASRRAGPSRTRTATGAVSARCHGQAHASASFAHRLSYYCYYRVGV